jgi:hypothetical protein
MTRPQRKWAWLAAGLLLRLVLIYFPRSFDDDTTAYLELGRNLLHHGTYGMTLDSGAIQPSLFRLPGYPIFLALLGGKFWLVEIVQSLLDLWGSWLLSLAVGRKLGERAAEWTLALSTMCLFTAAYAATALTESLSVFAICCGIYAFGEWQRSRALLPLAASAALAMLLRPDGVLLTTAIFIALAFASASTPKLWLRNATIFAALACFPLGIWAARNYATFHIFQPLAPRHVNDPGERVNLGFYRWLRTWSVEFETTGTVYWAIGEDELSMDNVPPRAYDSEAQRAETADLFAAYNIHHDIDAPLDARFAALAAQRIHDQPLRYYFVVPIMRIADMLFRPATAAFNIDVFFWQWSDHPWQSAAAIAFGLLNLAYFALALAGCIRGGVPFAALLASYFILRCILLGTLENPEPRYALELYPILIVAAASLFAPRRINN